MGWCLDDDLKIGESCDDFAFLIKWSIKTFVLRAFCKWLLNLSMKFTAVWRPLALEW